MRQWRAPVMGVVLCLISSSSMSCSEHEIDCEIDNEFTPSEQSEIRRAASAWNATAWRQVHFAEDGDWLILRAGTTGGLGYAEPKRGLIRISPSTPHEQIYAVALHELGHALGLKHVSKGVMDPNRQTIEFSPEDMTECRRVGACEE